MSIDWEELLGAEGSELQDAYDRAVEDWDRQMEWPESKPRAKRKRKSKWTYDVRLRSAGEWDDFGGLDGVWDQSAVKKRPPSSGKTSSRKAEDETRRWRLPSYGIWKLSEPTPFWESIREKLEAAFHRDFCWERDAQGFLMCLADSEGRPVMLKGLTRVRYLTYPFCSGSEALDRKVSGECGGQPLDVRYQDRNPHWEYDSAHMPLKLSAASGETLWDRAASGEGLTWKCVLYTNGGDPELVPLCLSQDGVILWRDLIAERKANQAVQENLASLRESAKLLGRHQGGRFF